ncbi:MAG: 30S ribosomal protein S20 [Candidatus Peribacteraceae bacterium]|nr:30S ribosomal protein S20 [Candidatus Peribacteraceae bacterium]
MPIIKSSIKRAKQNDVRRERRQPYKTRLKTATKNFLDLVKAGKKEEAAKLLPITFKTIDTATKKHILHRNTADRRKSRFSKLLK